MYSVGNLNGIPGKTTAIDWLWPYTMLLYRTAYTCILFKALRLQKHKDTNLNRIFRLPPHALSHVFVCRFKSQTSLYNIMSYWEQGYTVNLFQPVFHMYVYTVNPTQILSPYIATQCGLICTVTFMCIFSNRLLFRTACSYTLVSGPQILSPSPTAGD